MRRIAVTRDQALWTAVNAMGGLISCDVCDKCLLEDYVALHGEANYDDLAFGLWLLDQGWLFDFEEHPEGWQPGKPRLPFPPCYPPSDPKLKSWTFRFTCPNCRDT